MDLFNSTWNCNGRSYIWFFPTLRTPTYTGRNQVREYGEEALLIMPNRLEIFKKVLPPQDLSQGFVLPSNHPLVEVYLVSLSSCELIAEPIEKLLTLDPGDLSATIGEDHAIL